MTIQVQYQPTEYIYDWGEFVCQHASTHVESLDYGYPDASISDYVDDWRDTDVCDDCGKELLDD
jgi:hypothetical protein